MQTETPILNNLSLLWGGDYSNEDSEGNFDVFDSDEFDNSDRTRAIEIGTAIRIPPYEIENLGFFSQLQWDATESLAFSGGVPILLV